MRFDSLEKIEEGTRKAPGDFLLSTKEHSRKRPFLHRIVAQILMTHANTSLMKQDHRLLVTSHGAWEANEGACNLFVRCFNVWVWVRLLWAGCEDDSFSFIEIEFGLCRSDAGFICSGSIFCNGVDGVRFSAGFSFHAVMRPLEIPTD